MDRKISVVIPCYKSEHTIKSVVSDAIQTIRNHGEYDYEIILVNDHSPDKVFDVITELATENSKVIGIDLSRNFGQHSALMAGFQYISGDIIVAIDDDGQTPATEMFKLIDIVEEPEYDVVFAKYQNNHQSGFRSIGTKVNDLMARWLIGKPKELAITSFFAAKRFIIEEVKRYSNSYPYVSGLLIRATNDITNVVVEHRERQFGKSTYNFSKLLDLWLNGFTSFSIKPLRIAVLIGFLCATIGFVYGIFTIIKKMLVPTTPLGYSSTLAIILFTSGIIMLILGIIGEYVGRIYISINNAPQYIIRKTTAKNSINDYTKDKDFDE